MNDLIADEYKVRLDVFEGPLDLLLYLIRKNEVDIYDIPIGLITKQYMEYLGLMRMLDLNIAGDFLVMAATLMMIKSRMLLPEDERPEGQEDDEQDDPRWDLVRQLVEYKKFKDAADHLESLELYQENVFGREGEHLELGPQPDLAFSEVGIFDLISALNQALARVREDVGEIFAERFTIAEKVDQILELTSEGRSVSVSRIFHGMKSRQEIVCTFLAVLELLKLNELEVHQAGPFGEIVIQRADVEAARQALLSPLEAFDTEKPLEEPEPEELERMKNELIRETPEPDADEAEAEADSPRFSLDDWEEEEDEFEDDEDDDDDDEAEDLEPRVVIFEQEQE